MIKIKDAFKIFIMGSVSVLTLFAFQNCGNVKVQEPEPIVEPSVQAKGISGIICASNQAVSQVSRYELNHFVILNLTSIPKDNKLISDSNINSIDDQDETDLNLIPTIEVSNKDSDSDGIPDFIEEIRSLKQNDNDLFLDGSDQDGLTNIQEVIQGSDVSSSSSPPELNRYSIAEISTDDECEPSQKNYQFNIEFLQRVSTSSFNDIINSGDTSLSHTENENVFLVYAHLTPDRVTESDKKLFKIFKIKKEDKDFYLNLKFSDFNLLPNPK